MVVLRAQQPLDTGLHHRLRPSCRFDIDNDINMFEAAKDNRCSEYSPWSYNLLGGTPGNKTILEDDDGQDLNNSMVNDIVAKLLDDDCISGNDVFTSRCNGNSQQYQAGMSTAQDCKSRLSSNAYLTNTNGFHTSYPSVQMPNGSLNVNEDEHELRCAYDGLNTLSVNSYAGQQNLTRGNSYSNGYSNNLQRTSNTPDNIQHSGQQYSAQIINDRSYSPARSSYTSMSSNGLLSTSSGSNHSSQSNNWSESLVNSEGGKDLFGHYSPLQSCNSTDYNFNMAALNLALDSPDVALNDVLHYDAAPVNSHCNSMIHDSYNVSANGQNYRPSSTVTDLSVDSGFLSNSPLQHFSPPEHTMQNCFPNNLHRAKFDEYKEYHETSNLNVNNLMMSNEQLYIKQQQLKQQQQQQQHLQQQHQQNARVGSKFDNSVAMDQAFKRLLSSHYPNLLEQQQQYSPPNDFDVSNGMSLADQQRLDAAILRMLGSKSIGSNGCSSNQTREKQVYSPVGYQRNMVAVAAAAAAAAAREAELQQLKFNHQSSNDCQRLVVNNADALKVLHHQNAQAAFQNNQKRSNNVTSAFKPKANYDFANGMNFPPSNSLAHHQQPHHMSNTCVNGVDPEIFNHLLKQRQQHQHQQQQQQRLKGMPSISPAADVLFNAGLMQSAANAGVFPPHSVMPIPMGVPPSMSFFEAGLGMRNGTPIKRSGPARVLYLRLEQTYEQFKQLEKERKKCEAGLAAHFPGKKVSSANNIPIPRLQGSPSRVDRLIIDHYREHARVITLVAKMEHLRGACINQRVHKAMEQWLDTIKFVQDCRKQEITNGTKRQKDSLHCVAFQDENDILILADSIYKLTKASRYARSAMYNAMQSTLLYDRGIETNILETNQDVVLTLVPKETEATDQTSTATSTAPMTASSPVAGTTPTAEEATDRT